MALSLCPARVKGKMVRYTILKIKFMRQAKFLSVVKFKLFLTKGFIKGAMRDIMNKILNNSSSIHAVTYFTWLFLTGSSEGFSSTY